jgi:hypothetical protein
MNISVSARDEKRLNRRARGDRRGFSLKKAKNKTNFLNISSSLRSLGSPRFMVLFSLWGIKIFLSLDPPRMKARG